MKVILLENIRKFGSIGEIIDVRRGFARNFLISKKKALFASKANIKEVEIIKQKLNKKDEEKKKKQNLFKKKLKIKFLKSRNLVQKIKNYMDLLNQQKFLKS